MGTVLKLNTVITPTEHTINQADLPVVTDKLLGFYSGRGSVTNDGNYILEMPPAFSEGPIFKRIIGQTRSPMYPYSVSAQFKGSVIRSFIEGDSGAQVAGIVAPVNVNLTAGISFTFLYFRLGLSTGSNRTLFGFEPIGLQFRCNSAVGLGHLQLLGTSYDVGFSDIPSGSEAITLTLNRTEVKLYRNGLLISTTNISAASLPVSAEGLMSLMGNWTGGSGLLSHQTKQIYIHSKVLTGQEVQSIHSVLPSLLIS